MRNLLIILLLAAFTACQTQTYSPELDKAFERAGDNQVELKKVFDHYSQLGDTAKYRAAEFLVSNIRNKHCFVSFVVADSNGVAVPFEVLDYSNYTDLLNNWDSLETIHGKLDFKRDTLIKDIEVIKAKFLIKNIDMAFHAWEMPWAQHLSFDQFCEFLLPYRSTNEPLENWRGYSLENYSWLKDSMANSNDPVLACNFINNEIRSWFRFDERFYEHPTDQSLSQIMELKLGRCEDMTNLAIMIMRAWGVPVMSDFTPYWANTGNNHAWNAILDKDGNTTIFMGGEANPGEYKLTNIFAKVYRKSFAPQANSLVEIKKSWEQAPPYLNSPTIIDVTSEYTQTFTVDLTLNNDQPDSTEFAYMCVFNSGKWKPIAWGKVKADNKVSFENMGAGIAYLPAYFKNDEIIPAANAIILSNNGTVKPLAAGEESITHNLNRTTKRTSGQTTDNIGESNLNNNDNYELFYWNNEWVSIGAQTPENGTLAFAGLPENALYWLVGEKGRKEERIFTIEKDTVIWW